MNRTIYTLDIFIALMAGTALTSCQDSGIKNASAETATQNDPEQNNPNLAPNAEYPAFRKDAEVKMDANDKHIAELREKLNTAEYAPGNNLRKQRIDDLEQRNAELRSRVYGYEKERTDWDAFKREFNHDSDNLHDAFRDFGEDLKK